MEPLSNNKRHEVCPDWIYSASSDVHVAKDKAWFTTYHEFPSYLDSIYGISASFPVLGIGSVKLTVKARPNTFTVYGTSTIELSNVLHVPSHVCNVLGRPLASVYQINLESPLDADGPLVRGGLSLAGKEVAHFRRKSGRPFSLAVLPPEGTLFGSSPFRNGASYTASCHWPNEERVRWQATQDQVFHDRAPPLYTPPYTWMELDYINKRWGSEFRFLTQYRLKLHEERDRDEGRRIVRALMKGTDPEKREGYMEVAGKFDDYLLP